MVQRIDGLVDRSRAVMHRAAAALEELRQAQEALERAQQVVASAQATLHRAQSSGPSPPTGESTEEAVQAYQAKAQQHASQVQGAAQRVTMAQAEEQRANERRARALAALQTVWAEMDACLHALDQSSRTNEAGIEQINAAQRSVPVGGATQGLSRAALALVRGTRRLVELQRELVVMRRKISDVLQQSRADADAEMRRVEGHSHRLGQLGGASMYTRSGAPAVTPQEGAVRAFERAAAHGVDRQGRHDARTQGSAGWAFADRAGSTAQPDYRSSKRVVRTGNVAREVMPLRPDERMGSPSAQRRRRRAYAAGLAAQPPVVAPTPAVTADAQIEWTRRQDPDFILRVAPRRRARLRGAS
jgi:hypothetical protein